MASETKDLLSNPLPLMAVALLAAGVLVRTLPLESARPHDAVPPAASAIGEQDVRARLWQDPFEVVPRPARREAPAERLKRVDNDPLHAPEKLTAQIDNAIATPGARVTILGVMVFGSPYAEDVELRRRTRYAVLSGLAARRYVPDNSGALGYMWTGEGPSAQDAPIIAADTKAEPKEAQPKQLRLPPVVPYEWFTLERPQRGSKAESRQQAALKEIPAQDKVLVLWLDEDGFGDAALRGLSVLMQQIGCGADTDACRSREGAASVRILGPAGSGTFKSIIEAANKPPPADQVKLQFVSAFATVPRSEAHEVPKAWREKLAILRTIGGDDDLAQALLDELALRRVNPAAAKGRPECHDGIVLVSEWDTDYGRSLPAVLREKARERCGENAPVRWFSYLRGLDGTLPGAADESKAKRDTKSRDPADAEELLSRSVPRDRSEGRSQFDYLRRLGDRIRMYDDLETSQGRPGVRAIGVLGSDVYDKLLVLQALRPMFPDAVFFTTDMDARLTHPDQNAWARNLVVASHFGLALHPGLQRDVPPFRDGYQTAAFLGTQMALARGEKAPGRKWSTNGWPAASRASRRSARTKVRSITTPLPARGRSPARSCSRSAARARSSSTRTARASAGAATSTTLRSAATSIRGGTAARWAPISGSRRRGSPRAVRWRRSCSSSSPAARCARTGSRSSPRSASPDSCSPACGG